MDSAERAQAELMLSDSELRARLAIDIAGLGTFRCDPVTGLLDCDARMRELWGEPAQRAIVPLSAALQRIHPDDRERVGAALQGAIDVALQVGTGASAGTALQGGSTTDCRIVRADGSERWICVNGALSASDGSGPPALLGSVLDITARVQAESALRKGEAALRAGEEKYKALFEQIDEGFCVIEVMFDADDKPFDYLMLEVNPAFERQSGMRDARGKTRRELTADMDLHRLDTFGNVALTGAAVRFVDYSQPLKRWFDIYAFRLGDAAERKVAVVFNDITERKLAEAVLRTSEERQSYLLALSDALRPLADPAEIQGVAAELLGERLGVGRAFYYEFDEQSGYGVIHRDYVRGDAAQAAAPSLVGRHYFDDFTGSHMALRQGHPLLIADIDGSPLYSAQERVNYAALAIHAFACVPLVKSGGLVAVFGVAESAPRRWTGEELDLLEETAQRTWAAVERARAEQALRFREAELALVQRIGGIGGIDIDVVDSLRGWRSADYLRLHGLPPDTRTETHETWLARVHPDDRERADRAVREALAGTGSSYESEYRIVRPRDGEIRWILARADIRRAADGTAQRLIGAHIDITARKRIEARLAAELAGAKVLQRMSAQLLIDQRPEALYTQLLEAARELMQADAASIQLFESDQAALRLLASNNFHPDSALHWGWVRADSGSACGTALARGERIVIGDVENGGVVDSGELSAYRNSGLRSLQATPLLSRSGKPLGMISTHWRRPHVPLDDELHLFDVLVRQAADLIERVQAEDILRANEERQAFLLTLSDALRPLADAGAIQDVAARLLGERLRADRVLYFEVETEADGDYHIVRRTFHTPGMPDLVGRWRADDFGGFVSATLRNGRTLIVGDAEAVAQLTERARAMQRATGTRAYIAVPLIKEGRHIASISAHYAAPHEFTQAEIELVEQTAERTWAAVERATAEAALRESEERLREADLRKDEFLATLAHELRNPLATIRTAVHLLGIADASIDPGQVRDMLERQVNQMVRLIDDLMEVSRISRGAIDLKRQPLDLGLVVADAIEAAQPAIERAGHRLTVRHCRETLHVLGDPLRLVQILSNLLNNAVRYTDAGGEIEVITRREHDFAYVAVVDTGIGIAAAKLPGVFAMFGQIDRNDPRSQGGLGIGLALAQRLAQMHGGNIAAASAGQGRGSTFTVRLPLLHSLLPELDAATPGAVAATVSRKVLVVDDNRDAADVVGLLLRSCGVEVKVVHNGEDALAVLDDWTPNVMLLDLGMPGIDGYEVARRVRARPQLEAVKLVALTGWGQQADILRTQACGFDHHLVKPASANQLLALLA